jgi:hypothetical protein
VFHVIIAVYPDYLLNITNPLEIKINTVFSVRQELDVDILYYLADIHLERERETLMFLVVYSSAVTCPQRTSPLRRPMCGWAGGGRGGICASRELGL